MRIKNRDLFKSENVCPKQTRKMCLERFKRHLVVIFWIKLVFSFFLFECKNQVKKLVQKFYTQFQMRSVLHFSNKSV